MCVFVVDDDSGAEAAKLVERGHPFGVSLGEVVIYGDDVNAFSGERVEDYGKGADEGFSFAGFHFCNFALVKYGASDKLHVKVDHVPFQWFASDFKFFLAESAGGVFDPGEDFWQEFVYFFWGLGEGGLPVGKLFFDTCVGKILVLGFKLVYLRQDLF